MNNRERSALFLRARREASPAKNQRRRVRAAIASKLAGAAAGSVTAAASKAAATGSKFLSMMTLAAKGAAIATVVATTALATVHATSHRADTTPATSATASPHIAIASNAPTRAPSTAPILSSLPTPVSAPITPIASTKLETIPHRVVAMRAAPATEILAKDSALDPEPISVTAPPLSPPPSPAFDRDDLALIERMQLALRDGDVAHALALADEHERRFPTSRFTPEREGAKTIARCAHEDARTAIDAARAFTVRYPDSPLTARVRVACDRNGAMNDFPTTQSDAGQ